MYVFVVLLMTLWELLWGFGNIQLREQFQTVSVRCCLHLMLDLETIYGTGSWVGGRMQSGEYRVRGPASMNWGPKSTD